MSVARYMQSCSLVELEQLEIQLPEHADYLIICKDLLVIVEETKRSKLEDVEALEKTIDWVLSNYPSSTKSKFYAIVHYHRASDPHIPKLLMQKIQSARKRGRAVLYYALRCRSRAELVEILNRQFNLTILF